MMPSQQILCIDTIKQVLSIVNAIGINNDYMIIAGTGVYLHELNVQGTSSRQPTDLDIVLKTADYQELTKDILKSFDNPPHSRVKGFISPQICSWCTSLTPGIRILFQNNFQVDLLTQGMALSFGLDAPMLKNKTFDFLAEQDQVFDLSSDIKLSTGCQVRVAHPVFIAVYKLLLQREKNGKQDISDVRRLKNVGLLNRSTSSFEEMLSLLTKGNINFQEALLNLLELL